MPQVICFAANTEQQVIDFNKESPNTWSGIRGRYKIKPISVDLVAECVKDDLQFTNNGDTLISYQCRELSKKFKTKSSPTMVYVNEMGEVIKVDKKGYTISSSYKETIENINIWK